MKLRCVLTIPEGTKFMTKLLYFAEVSYQMFPEHVKEFSHQKYESKFLVPLPEDEYSPNHHETEVELPFGTVSCVLKYRESTAEDQKVHDITVASINNAFKNSLEPIPISMAEQALKDKEEEDLNKKREQDAR